MSVSSKYTTITAIVLMVLAAAAVLFLFFGAADDSRFTLRFLGNPVKLRFYGELKSKDLKLPREDISKIEDSIASHADAMKGVDVRVTKINSYDQMTGQTRIMVSIKVRTERGTVFSPAPEVMLRKDMVRKLMEMVDDQAEDIRSMAEDGRYTNRNLKKVVTE